ncbi:F-type H+-transporting ATPase subunit a [Melghirimyces profundicolus]|uniref:ATP synthase subunit a n=1 Tax=Melghirimyces profundicolus TaxID=1242148 RepID=A0A2T6C2G0_9BACL|nr:F0F1 ATP synthase subunit A [Melghirimyces profundicolus]PTX62511.1 F-type H+-transporting ATPase subunit a [Melghirimyces profundicolus]
MELSPKVEFLGLSFDVPVMIGTVFTAIVVLLLTVLATRNPKMRPGGLQNLVEMLLDFVRGILNISFDSKTAEKYLGFALTLFLFIFIANQLGVMLMVTTEVHHPIPSLGITGDDLEESHAAVWFKSPTADLNVTVVMAVAISLFAHFMGIFRDAKGYFSHYMQPNPLMFPIHLVDEIAKPTTHALRLWANIFAGEVLITIMITYGNPLTTGAPLLVWLGYSLFVGTIQAYVFTVLASVYIAQKTVQDH